MPKAWRERVRIEVAVQRIGWWLDWNCVPGRRRREVRAELRAGLADAAAAGELDAAVARLGRPRDVAEAYVEESPGGLRWRAGWFAALVGYTLVVWLSMAAAIGFAEGVQAVGAEVGQVYETGHSLAFGDAPLLSFEESGRGLSFTVPLAGWPHLLVAGAGFFVFARPWRALIRPRSPASV